MKTLLTFLTSALAISLAAWIAPGVGISSLWAALFLVVILSLINLVIKPVILFLTLPLNLLTLGLFTFVINALMISLAAYLTPGFSVAGFWSALFFSLILSIVISIFEMLFKDYSSNL